MSRKPRYHIPGAFYHIMLRGNDKQTIFRNDTDRCRLCLLIQHGVERYGHRIHAFCFMSNHIHLLVQTNHVSLSKIIHNLAFRYSQYFNRRYGKIGHLFQGRYKAILLDEEGYFLKLLRYIHMNPVRAKIVKEPLDYKWSSHETYLGENEITWLTIEHGLAKFDMILGSARKLYNGYILKMETKEGLDELRKKFKDGQILGTGDFVENVRKIYRSKIKSTIPLSVIIKATCAILSIEEAELSSSSQSRRLSLARSVIVAEALENKFTLNEMAIAFKRDESTISRIGTRLSTKYHQCKDVRELHQQVKEKILQLATLQA